MANESRFNPLSKNYTGELPEELHFVALMAFERPAPEFLAKNPEWDPKELPPDPLDREIVVMVTGERVIPDKLRPGEMDKWSTSGPVPLGPLSAPLSLTAWRELTPIKERTALRAVDPETVAKVRQMTGKRTGNA